MVHTLSVAIAAASAVALALEPAPPPVALVAEAPAPLLTTSTTTSPVPGVAASPTAPSKAPEAERSSAPTTPPRPTKPTSRTKAKRSTPRVSKPETPPETPKPNLSASAVLRRYGLGSADLEALGLRAVVAELESKARSTDELDRLEAQRELEALIDRAATSDAFIEALLSGLTGELRALVERAKPEEVEPLERGLLDLSAAFQPSIGVVERRRLVRNAAGLRTAIRRSAR